MQVNGLGIYPATGLLVMVLEGTRQLMQNSDQIIGYRLSDVNFSRALISTPDVDDFETNLHIQPLEQNSDGTSRKSQFRVYSHRNGQWVENCRGTIEAEYPRRESEVDGGKEATEDFERHKEIFQAGLRECDARLDLKSLYRRFGGIGLTYGPSFQVLDNISYCEGQAVGRIKLRKWAEDLDEANYESHVIHPTALDGLFQLLFPATFGGTSWNSATLVPRRI